METYIGQIILFAGNTAPQNWALCNGQTLSVSQNHELFNVIGSRFGGDGQTTFCLPDLRGRAPIGQGPAYALGAGGGLEEITLNAGNLPSHNHAANGVAGASANTLVSSPEGALWANDASGTYQVYNSGATLNAIGQLSSSAIGASGSTNPASIDTLPPYLPLNYIICTLGIYPQPSQSGLAASDNMFTGEIALYSFGWVPAGMLPCDGRKLMVAQYKNLHDAIGNAYGGDETTFYLPNLSGRAAIHQGHGTGLANYKLGQTGGSEQETLQIKHMPLHTHSVSCTTSDPASGFVDTFGTSADPENNLWAETGTGIQLYSSAAANTTLNSEVISQTGGGTPFDNRSPYLPLNYAICTNGVSAKATNSLGTPGFTGQISLFAFNVVPTGWLGCNGQTLHALTTNTQNEILNQTLYMVIQNTFGGTNMQNFGVPDLQGRRAIGAGQGKGLSNHPLGESGGSETVGLSPYNLPSHSHYAIMSQEEGDSSTPTDSFWAEDPSGAVLNYSVLDAEGQFLNMTTMNQSALSTTGGKEPLNTLPPYLTLNYCICLGGTFPTQG